MVIFTALRQNRSDEDDCDARQKIVQRTGRASDSFVLFCQRGGIVLVDTCKPYID